MNREHESSFMSVTTHSRISRTEAENWSFHFTMYGARPESVRYWELPGICWQYFKDLIDQPTHTNSFWQSTKLQRIGLEWIYFIRRHRLLLNQLLNLSLIRTLCIEINNQKTKTNPEHTSHGYRGSKSHKKSLSYVSSNLTQTLMQHTAKV